MNSREFSRVTGWPHEAERARAFQLGREAFDNGASNPHEMHVDRDLYDCWEAGYQYQEELSRS